MKYYFILLVLFTSVSFSQSASLSVLQDGKLLFFNDDHKNTPPTANFEIRLTYRTPTHIIYYVSNEYADLYGGVFNRTAVGTGIELDYKYLSRLSITPSVFAGALYRRGEFYDSVGLNCLISYRITDSWSFLLNNQFSERKELLILYEDPDYWRYSVFIGIDYKL